MGKRIFKVTLTVDLEVELDDRVIDQVNTDWRKTFYEDVRTPEDVAEFVAMNMTKHSCTLHMVEGFANLPDGLAEVLDEEWSAEVEEIDETGRLLKGPKK